MKRIDAARIQVEMVGIRARRIVIGILRRANAQPARHMHHVADANLGARIAGASPFRDRRRLPDVVDTLFDQNAHQRRGEALAHGPAFERCARRDAVAVAFGDQASAPSHDESGGHAAGGIECCIDRLLEFARVDLHGRRIGRQHIAHRPSFGGRIGQLALHGHRREMNCALTKRQRHTSLATEIFGCPRYPVRKRDVDGLLGAIDDRFAQLVPHLVRSGEITHVLGGEIRIEFGDEYGRAHSLGEARGVMLKRVAGRRHVGCIELERRRPRNQCPLRCARLRECVERMHHHGTGRQCG